MTIEWIEASKKLPTKEGIYLCKKEPMAGTRELAYGKVRGEGVGFYDYNCFLSPTHWAHITLPEEV